MKIPKKINVLGDTFTIKLIGSEKLACHNKLVGAKVELDGYINYINKTIYLNKDYTEASQIKILLHELGHLFQRYYHIGGDEIFAEAFSRYVFAIMVKLK